MDTILENELKDVLYTFTESLKELTESRKITWRGLTLKDRNYNNDWHGYVADIKNEEYTGCTMTVTLLEYALVDKQHNAYYLIVEDKDSKNTVQREVGYALNGLELYRTVENNQLRDYEMIDTIKEFMKKGKE